MNNIVNIKNIISYLDNKKTKNDIHNNIYENINFHYERILDIKERNSFINELNNIIDKFENNDLNIDEKNKLIQNIFESFLIYFDTLCEFIINEYKIDEDNKKLLECMKYALLSNGKRLRTFLMFTTAYIFDNNKCENSFSVDFFMLAMEMIHAFSLIHDDMPCIDNDELRRGKPSTWKQYGEDLALLAGDALLNLSYEIIHSLISYYSDYYSLLNNSKIDNKEKIDYLHLEIKNCQRALFILSKNTGINGMIGGETNDVLMNESNANKNSLKNMYLKKTSALINASISIGRELIDNKEFDDSKTLCSEIGTLLGFSYQLQDDILELTMTSEQIGKSNNSDEKNNKITYIKYNGIDETQNELKENLIKIFNNIDNFKNVTKGKIFYKSIINYIFERKK